MSEISVREANEPDHAFIYATFLKSYRTSNFAQNIPSPIYFSWHHKIIELFLKRAKVYIAHPTDYPSTIIGYLICEPELKVIHYAYTKYDFQKMGVATTLINHSQIDLNSSQFSHATKEMDWIVKKYPSFQYNPYAL